MRRIIVRSFFMHIEKANLEINGEIKALSPLEIEE